MTRDLRQERKISRIERTDCNRVNNEADNNSQLSGSSVYTMAAVAGCLLLCIGIVVYALICG